jgi:hypothetical protein
MTRPDYSEAAPLILTLLLGLVLIATVGWVMS